MASEGDVEKGKQDNADENVSSIAYLVVILRNDTVINQRLLVTKLSVHEIFPSLSARWDARNLKYIKSLSV